MQKMDFGQWASLSSISTHRSKSLGGGGDAPHLCRLNKNRPMKKGLMEQHQNNQISL